MSSSPQYSSSSTPAPWRALFLEHVKTKMQQPEFVLSTLQPAPAGSSTPYIPHARTCIFRGMWTELPENEHNEAPQNERVFESDMPAFTTDARMEKISDIFGSSSNGPEQASSSSCGGGAPVEAVWWVKDVMTQWRLRGEAFVVGPDVEEPSASDALGIQTLRSEVCKRMRVVKPGSEKDWSWSKELTAHFGNMAPIRRGAFKQPPPGQPVDQPYNDKELEFGSKVTDLHDPVCRRHFRVVIIRPKVVDQVNLNDMVRYRYTYNDATDSWETQPVWP